jgi:2-hydroxychromene-2-carboxylate isomerase
VKKLYILHDAKREADRAGIAFGNVCDPLGVGIDNCLAIMHWALQRSPADGLAFAKSALRGAWSEARDMAEYVDLRAVVERAGLPWEEARAQLDKPEGMKAATTNVADLNVVSLWGVPSMRCGEFVAWGQDRLPLLADRLRRHALATASGISH